MSERKFMLLKDYEAPFEDEKTPAGKIDTLYNWCRFFEISEQQVTGNTDWFKPVEEPESDAAKYVEALFKDLEFYDILDDSEKKIKFSDLRKTTTYEEMTRLFCNEIAKLYNIPF